MNISTYTIQGLEYIELENEKIRTQWLPELGGKLVSFFDKPNAQELLHGQPSVTSPPSLPKYGSEYSEYMMPGVDECFPTIDASDYMSSVSQNKKKTISLPEHGEIWALPWHTYSTAEEFIFRIQGVGFDYEFEKHVQLRGHAIELTYFLTNKEAFAFDYVWAAHAEFVLKEHDAILIEPATAAHFHDEGMTTIYDSSGATAHMRAQADWCSQNGESTVPGRMCSDQLQRGICGIQRHQGHLGLLVQFSTQHFTHLAIQCAAKRTHPHNTICHVSLMPSIGWPGSLSEAIQTEQSNNIAPQTRRHWKITLKSDQNATNPYDLVAIECHG